jgi:hypothetical protein
MHPIRHLQILHHEPTSHQNSPGTTFTFPPAGLTALALPALRGPFQPRLDLRYTQFTPSLTHLEHVVAPSHFKCLLLHDTHATGIEALVAVDDVFEESWIALRLLVGVAAHTGSTGAFISSISVEHQRTKRALYVSGIDKEVRDHDQDQVMKRRFPDRCETWRCARQGCVIKVLTTELECGRTPFDWALSLSSCTVHAGDGATELL